MRRLKRLIEAVRRLLAGYPDRALDGPGYDLVKLSKKQQAEHFAHLRQQERGR